MPLLIKPVLVDFELVSQGNQITIWASTPVTKFLARVNDINHVFLSTGIERHICGKWAQGFKGYPMGTEIARKVDLSDCQVAILAGSLRASKEDLENPCRGRAGKL